MKTDRLERLRSPNGIAAVALVYTAAALTVLEYWYMPFEVEWRLSHRYAPISLRAGLTWAVATAVLYMVGPILITVFLQREKLANIGYSWKGFVRHLPLYLGLFALTLPALWLASRRADFASTYPYVQEALRSRGAFVRWEAAYLLSFFTVEAYFRGFLLFTLERAMGWLAVFVMIVPYCMIHWHKPPLEAFSAILGGTVLGFLALRYRSFYGGFLVHVLVALTMDVLAAGVRAGLF